MPDLKLAYIDPKAALGALTVTKADVVVENLGPSGPHQFDEEVVEAKEPVAVPGLSTKTPTVAVPGLSVKTPVVGTPSLSMHSGTPSPSLSPGSPPLVVAAHYTQLLDELWPEFDEPEERTAERLMALLEEVIDEAQRVHLLAQDVWDNLPEYKVPESERKRYDKEFIAYLRRLQDYKKTLMDLEPESTATDTVYIGLVKRRDGAGPVPDAIMHLYFAQQLGILSDHADEMSEGFVGRVMDGLAKTREVIREAADEIAEVEDEAEKKLDSWWERVTRPWKIAGGVLLGTAALVSAAVIADRITDERERDPWR